MCHRKMHHDSNMETRKLVSDTITTLPRANTDLLARKSRIFSVCTQVKSADAYNEILRLAK
jgi:hypothetical protein